ncbi:hypothetical protein O6H91_01G058700 [Diphasiastrum complanatum]|uniref:Uncharacterized protein n=1 Tax=Diphasiastrum complanatum TaxID=34168 RepID=A0ACC2ERB0_DIPCM|nr:hypothetical protein O6H91_01G058700 [Diphasiastrum complanatum]
MIMMHSLMLSQTLVACKNLSSITNLHFLGEPTCSISKKKSRMDFTLFQVDLPKGRILGFAKKSNMRCTLSLVDASKSRNMGFTTKKNIGFPPSVMGVSQSRNCLRGQRRDVQPLTHPKDSVWDEKSLAEEEVDEAGMSIKLAVRNMLERLGVLAKLQNPNLVWLLLAAVELLDASYALGVNKEPIDCTAIARQDNTTLIVITCIVEAIALTGAAVGGILARQRKVELERINAQLRQIFARMRRQYQVEAYAPSLTYAPAGISRLPDSQIAVDPRREELMERLKAGKKFLREQNPQKAFDEFEKALPLAKELKDVVEEKKAARGLGASCQRQGRLRDAIKYHSMVLTLSHLTGEHFGDTEALGAIADCYTELGDLETAGKYYDQYIARLDCE